MIDAEESCALFERVRLAEPNEQWLVQNLGPKARFAGQDVTIENLTALYEAYAVQATEENDGEKECAIEDVANDFEPSVVPISAVANGNDPAAAGGG